MDDRKALAGILFVLRSGIPWEMLPQEMGCGSGMTCWRRLRDWQAAGVWARLHRVLLDRLGRANAIDWSRCSLDSASVPGQRGASCTGPNPTDRGKPGSKRHVLVDASGIPLALALSAGERPRQQLLEPVLDAVPPIRQCAGRPRKRPAKLHADKGYDYPRCRRACRKRGIVPRIARRGVESSERLGRHRWVVGAHARLVRPLPPAHRPLRAARRHPRGVPPPRRRPDLPPLRRALVLLRPRARQAPTARSHRPAGSAVPPEPGGPAAQPRRRDRWLERGGRGQAQRAADLVGLQPQRHRPARAGQHRHVVQLLDHALDAAGSAPRRRCAGRSPAARSAPRRRAPAAPRPARGRRSVLLPRGLDRPTTAKPPCSARPRA